MLDSLQDRTPGRRAQSVLEGLEHQGLLRSLSAQTSQPIDISKEFDIDLTTNDSLDLRHETWLQDRLHRAAAGHPAGSGGSRLLGGNLPVFAAVEAAFAEYRHCEASVFFPSGYHANAAVARMLAALQYSVLSDQLNHASIIDGLRLVRGYQIFPHCQPPLNAFPTGAIVTESIFSMDGDLAPMDDLRRWLEGGEDRLAVIDEAHAVGAFGPGGFGLVGPTPHPRMIVVDPCGKALGLHGAMVSGPAWIKPLLHNVARTFIYTTAPSPWIAAALLEVLRLQPALDPRRRHLAALSSRLRHDLRKMGLSIGNTESHIVPVILGSNEAAQTAESRLAALGIRVRAIRPPTVPEGTARLRLSIHAGLDERSLRHIVVSLADACQAGDLAAC